MLYWVFLAFSLLSGTGAFAASVSDGLLDLSQERLDANSRLELNGLWRFYPKEFLKGSDFSGGLPEDKSPVMVTVPGELAGVQGPDGELMSSKTWGSFVLELRNIPSWVPELGLKLRGDTATRAFLVDGSQVDSVQLISQAGLPGKRPQESIPQVIEQLGRFKLPSGPGPYYLVIHLSGFFYASSGLWIPPTIGPIKVMERERDWLRLSECVILGMLLIMGLYNLSLYLHRREDVSSLWLAAFCGLILARFLATSGSFTAFLFPTSNVDLFDLIRKIEFGAVCPASNCLLVFIARTFGFHKFEKQLKWGHILVALLTAFIIVTDATVFPKLLNVIILYAFIVSSTVLVLIVIALKRGREGSLLALVGVLSLTIGGYHDTLIGLGKLQTPIFIMTYGMAALIFTQGQVIAKLFASAFRTADRLSRHLTEEVERQTMDIRSMLDHIPQGVMSLVAPGLIDPGFSRHLRAVISFEEVAGLTLDTVLLSRTTLSPDDRDRIQAALSSCLGEEILAFELNSAQLPSELRLQLPDGFKILQMTWNPVLDKNGIIAKILITCHDVTEVRRYEAEAQEQKQELTFIQELVNVSGEKFSIFYETSIRMLDENQRLINLNRSRNFEILKILFVNMHTIKGAARTLGFGKLTAWLHEVEHSYAELLKNPDQIWDQPQMAKDLDKTQELLEYYRRVNEQKLGRVLEKTAMIPVDREFLVQHTQMLKKIEIETPGGFNDSMSEALIRFEELAFQDSYTILQEISASAVKIAKDLGKAPPQIIIQGLHCGISFQAQQLLRKVFIHIIRNALDHGIETAEERVKHGKVPEGTILLNLAEVRNRLQITISDDGRGLSINKLERRALELGILTATHAAKIDELADLIFYPGLSTADSLTEVSGRGIGMDAVKSFIEESGGSIRIQIDPTQFRLDHCPFQLVISLPSTLYLRKLGESPSVISSAS